MFLEFTALNGLLAHKFLPLQPSGVKYFCKSLYSSDVYFLNTTLS